MNIEKALSNLKDLCLCFNNNSVEYWLSCGTLLGVIRDNSLIKHDNDVDVCVNSIFLNKEFVSTKLAVFPGFKHRLYILEQ